MRIGNLRGRNYGPASSAHNSHLFTRLDGEANIFKDSGLSISDAESKVSIRFNRKAYWG